MVSSPAQESERVTILLTPQQVCLLIGIVDDANVKGRAAAMIVSIQRALAEAVACDSPGPEDDAPLPTHASGPSW